MNPSQMAFHDDWTFPCQRYLPSQLHHPSIGSNIEMIVIGRFFTGVAIRQLSMVVPIYLSEVAHPNIRGSLIALQQLRITGYYGSFWLDYGTQHISCTRDGQSPAARHFSLAFQCVPSTILVIGTFFLSYSARWLMSKGKCSQSLTIERGCADYS